MERYEAYKDSGVKWIGEIPESWEYGRIRSVYSLRKELVEDGNPDDLVSVSEYYGVDYRRNRIGSSDVLARADSLEGYQKCYPNDLVMNIMLAWKGAQGTSAISGLVSPSYGVFQSLNGSCPRYYHYLFRTDQYKEYFKSYSSGIIDSRLRLYPEIFMHLNCHVPPLQEQERIADYLDAKTAEIDALVEDCEREVKLLQEYRKAVISEAVTKGLDPDAPMKDSGIEWIGEIPEQWTTARTKQVCSKITDGSHFSPTTVDDGYPYITATNIRGRGIDYSSAKLIDEQAFTQLANNGCQPKTGDVLMVKDGATTGRAGLMVDNEPCVILSSVALLRPTAICISDFLFYFIQSHGFQEQVLVSMAGSAMPRTTLDKLVEYALALPPVEDQEHIVGFLDAKTAEIDSLIEAKQSMADKLREYRRSLISEAVTGKFKVPGVK